MSKQLLFSVTKDQLVWDTFCAGGKGGSNQNAKAMGVRCRHVPSGACGEARDSRSQKDNKRAAFMRMAHSKTFQDWLTIQANRKLADEQAIEIAVDRQMTRHNLLVEAFNNETQKWERVD